MRKSEIQKHVLKIIANELGASGFILTENGIIRYINGIEQGVGITSGKFKVGIVLRVELYCEDSRIESFLKTTNFATIGPTIAVEIHHLDIKKIVTEGYWFMNEDKIETTIDEIIKDDHLYCLNYFERHSTREKIYSTLVQDNMWSWLNCTYQFSRCLRLISMSHNLGIPDTEIEINVKKCKDRISITQYYNIEKLNEAVTFLEQSKMELVML